MKRIVYTILFFILLSNVSFAAKVDTVSVFSPSMNRDIKTVTILPADYDSKKEFPTIYLLHGYSGNYSDWVNKAPVIKELADRYSLIIVCPDGGFGSWYWDSPVDPAFRFETFVSKELVSWADQNLKTRKGREGRAIIGLSMGGHGALYLAFKHQDVYGAAGSTSGGVDIRPFPLNWDMAKRLGSYAENSSLWEENTVINLTHLLTPGSLEIMIDCGTSDFFYAVNEELHDKLLLRNIPHTYLVKPGAHNWPYWTNSILYQILFMNEYFKKAESAS
ncbi:alpha/beta hydrolase [Albibacterium bauzanense]|uniref:S-formylglutathione hydrolase FrmB n=1 Tax=Albibacterium bauzanense TaxID=653929 RepID=A0A4V2PYE6_9SPHI|nr:alpha/beta hydrolase family protein [Albibacterium bauzanense]TCK85641.1 S-formylglutathione hydrolase FrmB [Albibacterium bauzanense]